MLWQLRNMHLGRCSTRLGRGLVLNRSGERAQKEVAVPLSGLQSHPSTGTRQLVSLGLGRSQAGQRVASRPSFLGLPPPKPSLQQHGGGGCLGARGCTQRWGFRGASLAGSCQLFPSLQRFGGLQCHRGCPKSHRLSLWAISKKVNEAFLPCKNTAWRESSGRPEWTGSDLLLDFGVKPQLSSNFVKRLVSGSLLLPQGTPWTAHPTGGSPLCPQTTAPGAGLRFPRHRRQQPGSANY